MKTKIRLLCFFMLTLNLGNCKSDSELKIIENLTNNDKSNSQKKINKILYKPIYDESGNETFISKTYYNKILDESKSNPSIEIINESNIDKAKLASYNDNKQIIKKYNPDILIEPDQNRIKIYDNSLKPIKSIDFIVKEEDLQSSTEKLVYYGTNRDIKNRSGINDYFGIDRSEKITYGFCKINIPGYKYRERGDLNTPYVILNKEIYKSEKRHFYIKETPTVLSEEDFIKQLNVDLSNNINKKKVLIFLHGYNTSFNDAALKTAQLTHDLQFEGTSIFYSWPSRAEKLGYPADENESRNSQHNLIEFLSRIYSNNRFTDIYIIAHSLGTRLISEIIYSDTKKIPNFKTKTKILVLAAPDIDPVYFRNSVAPSFAALKSSITIYANKNDKALSLSEQFHDSNRVGSISPSDNIYPYIETIDATGTGEDFLDHSYFSDSYKLLNDMVYLLKGIKAKNRDLLQINSKNGFYWRIQ
ncbi:alpha/beta hydrolase [Leptospira bourretii]|uniref:alpha/beta hydrolase n=1 Tax=Leptospira bourretii TaxID=2484962 RepID=UPI0010917989|nr:alpha/beta hydrolase [Leptospira bourretii]TGL17377.1 alpha/beta hydrolase [Leptospira bourretii]